MKILAIDTSTDFLGVAIIENEKPLASVRIKRPKGHSDYLVSLIDRVLKKARFDLKDIDGFAVSKGPGSFTGLRIGITAIRAIALAVRKPVIGVPTLDAIAYNERKRNVSSLICPILDAKQNKVYACIFENKKDIIKRKTKYLLLSIEGLRRYIKNTAVLFVGDGIKIYKERLKAIFGNAANFAEEKSWYPNPVIVARLGWQLLKSGKRDSPYDLVPMYLYPKECTISVRTKK